MANEKKSKLFGFFDYNRDNRPDAPEEDTTPTLKRYFKLLGRRFWKLISLNIMMIPMIIPLFVIFYLYISSDRTPTQNNFIFTQLYGANLIENTPETTRISGVFAGAAIQI